jgi:hypothetical protein
MIVVMLGVARQRYGVWVGASVSEQQVSRRQALKRGALAGGALVWTVPVVQAVSMTAAHAESASAPPAPHRASGGSSTVTGGSSAAGGSADQLSFTGTALPVAGAAVVGGGLLAAGIATTVAASRSGKLSPADGPAEPPGTADS